MKRISYYDDDLGQITGKGVYALKPVHHKGYKIKVRAGDGPFRKYTVASIYTTSRNRVGSTWGMNKREAVGKAKKFIARRY